MMIYHVKGSGKCVCESDIEHFVPELETDASRPLHYPQLVASLRPKMTHAEWCISLPDCSGEDYDRCKACIRGFDAGVIIGKISSIT